MFIRLNSTEQNKLLSPEYSNCITIPQKICFPQLGKANVKVYEILLFEFFYWECFDDLCVHSFWRFHYDNFPATLQEIMCIYTYYE